MTHKEKSVRFWMRLYNDVDRIIDHADRGTVNKSSSRRGVVVVNEARSIESRRAGDWPGTVILVRILPR